MGLTKKMRAVTFLALGLIIMGLNFAPAAELETIPLMPMAPDTNWAKAYVVDNFEYTGSPLDHGWGVLGTDTGAVVTTEYDSVLQSRVVHCQTSQGAGFGIYYPKGPYGVGSNSINIWRRYLYFYLSTTQSTFNMIVFINRQNCAANFIVYRLTNGFPYVSGDSIIVPLGANLADGRWHEVVRDLSADLHKGFSGEAFETRFIGIRGDFYLDSLILRNRPFIEGYANLTSVRQGLPIEFKVSMNRPGIHTFHFEFYREGAEREFKFATEEIPGSEQGVAPDAYREGAGWPSAYLLPGSLTQSWPSGAYVAKLVSDQMDSSFIPFVILQDQSGSTSNILFQVSTTTYQAYNYWGGGSLYAGQDSVVSFDRPYSELWYGPWSDGTGAGQFYAFELPLVRWLERNGYRVEYADNVSLNDTSFSINKYRLFLSVGHDEYWYETARNRLEYGFRDTLHNNLAFFSANCCFWRVREPQPNPNRKMITQKTCCSLPFFDLWRILITDGVPNPRPEASFIGLMYKGPNVRGNPVSVANGSHWIFRGTGLQTGSRFGFARNYLDGISGYERDSSDSSSPNNLEILATGSGIDQCGGGGPYLAQTAYYRIPGGSEVFAAGGIQWSWGLADGDSGTARVTKNIIDGLASTVRGKISQDTVWENRVYLGGDVVVDSGANLTIRPGTKIFFFPNNDVERKGIDSNRTEIVVLGKLLALGMTAGSNSVDSIIFCSAASLPQAGDWGGITVVGSGQAQLTFCRLSDADNALSLTDASSQAFVRDCSFTHFRSRAISSRSALADLGHLGCGRNNILMNTASPGARAVEYAKNRPPNGVNSLAPADPSSSHSGHQIFRPNPAGDDNPPKSSPCLWALGNWWDSPNPPVSWFLGPIIYRPFLAGGATADSCAGVDTMPATAVETRPLTFQLLQNAPNPFNARTRIAFSLPAQEKVTLTIYNTLGQKVRTLLKGVEPGGIHSVEWDADDDAGRTVASGLYICRLDTKTASQTKRMLLLK